MKFIKICKLNHYWLIFFLLIGFSSHVLAQTKEITFILNTETHTPEDETVVLHLENGWQFIPMDKISENRWQVTVNVFEGVTYRYKYCRNYMDSGAEEE